MEYIKIAVYGYDASEHDDIEGDEYVYDFEEMASELENRIYKKLGKKVLITISELEDDMDKDDMDINDLTFNPTKEEE